MAAAGMPFSMAAAGMTLFVMVMIAVRTGRYEFAIQIRFCSFIRISMHSGTKFHTRFIKCRLCSAADSTADQDIDSQICKQPSKRSVTGTV